MVQVGNELSTWVKLSADVSQHVSKDRVNGRREDTGGKKTSLVNSTVGNDLGVGGLEVHPVLGGVCVHRHHTDRQTDRHKQTRCDLFWPRLTLANRFSYFGHDLLWARPRIGQTVAPKKEETTKKGAKMKEALKPQRLGAGPGRVEGPEGCGPEGWGPRRVGGQKGPRRGSQGRKGSAQTQKMWGLEGLGPQDFAHLSPSPAPFSLFFFALGGGGGVFSWNCGHGSRPWTTQIARFGFSGVFCVRPGGLQTGPTHREGQSLFFIVFCSFFLFLLVFPFLVRGQSWSDLCGQSRSGQSRSCQSRSGQRRSGQRRSGKSRS